MDQICLVVPVLPRRTGGRGDSGVSHEEIPRGGGRIHLGCWERWAGRPWCARRHPVRRIGRGESGWNERPDWRSRLAGTAASSFGLGMVDRSEP
jgi:hypothetical protein